MPRRKLARMSAPWVLVGCGYTGVRLARALVQRGEAVTVTRRTAAAAQALAADLGAHAAGAAASLADPATTAATRVPPDLGAHAGGAAASLADPATTAATRVPPDLGAHAAGADANLADPATTAATRVPRELAGAAASRVRGVRADLSEPATLEGLVPAGAVVVVLAPPAADPAGELRALLAAAGGARRVVYVSSTGVYGAGGGAWVDETWPLAPLSASGRARVAAEQALSASPLSHVAVRVAGIYGPGRGLADRLRAGTYRVVGDGRAHVSRIHVDDLVAAILAAGTSSITGAINVADDDPAPIGEVADALAAKLGLPRPPRVSAAEVGAEVAAMLTADRRIANRRLKAELRVTLRYPSWRDAPV